MPQTYNNKIVLGNETLMDLTSDTVEPSKVLSGYTFHDRSGAPQTGSCAFDVDSSNATATAHTVLDGVTAGAGGTIITGDMPNRGAVTGTISDVSTPYTIQNGYHDGTGTVSIDSTEAAKIIPGNIKKDIEILGVTGTYEGGATPTSTAANVTPYTTAQTIVPSDLGNYDYISQVNVAAISRTDTLNAAGGYTVTIGDVAPSA